MTAFSESFQRVASQPERGARLVAHTFYRELRRGGFGEREIMAVADELLGCLAASLREYRLKKEIPVAAEAAGAIVNAE